MDTKESSLLDSSMVLGLQRIELINISTQGIEAVDLALVAYIQEGLLPMHAVLHKYITNKGPYFYARVPNSIRRIGNGGSPILWGPQFYLTPGYEQLTQV